MKNSPKRVALSIFALSAITMLTSIPARAQWQGNLLAQKKPVSIARAAPTPTPETSNSDAPPPPPASSPSAPADASATTTASPATTAAEKTGVANTAGAKTAAGKAALLLTPEKANPVRVKLFEKPPVIDGKLDDEVWKNATTFKDFIQTNPGDNIAPSKPTIAYMGYDSKFLYFAFHVYDDPGKVRATLAKRDNVFGEDNIRVFLDTFNDHRRAYVLGWNPLGVQADGIMTEAQGTDFSVDIVMESKGMITDDGWTVEAAVPFKSLRYEAGKDKVWGIHIWRNIDRFNDEIDSWMPISRDNSALLSQGGRITGLEGISTERTLELIPSLTVSETGKRVRTLSRAQIGAMRRQGLNPLDPGKLVNQPVGLDPGLTMKYSITPTVTLDLALNPDFAQVEADSTVVTANQRFPIFFPEKRPFFLEGVDIFNTIISAVNTRTISDPDIAVKLTGKQGRNSFGILLASDNAPGNYSDEKRFDPEVLPDARFIDKNSYVGVLRLKRDVGKENTVGLLATTYNFIDNHNHVAGLDGRFRLNKTTTFTAQALASLSTRFFFYPEEGARVKRTENGLAYAYNLNMDGRNWGYEYGAVGRSRFFREDVGFNRRFNTNNQNLFVRYQSTPKPKATLVNWRVFNSAGGNFDWSGRSQRFQNETQLQLSFQRQSFLGFGVQEGYERLFEEEFGPTRGALSRRIAGNFGASIAGSQPSCDPTGSAPPPDPAHPEKRLPLCTFFGNDTQRSVDTKSLYMFGGSSPSKKYSVFVFTIYNWGVLDFDFGASDSFPRVSPAALAAAANPALFPNGTPLDPGPANNWYLESNFTYKPMDKLNMSLDYTHDQLTRNDTGLKAYVDNIFSFRSTYQFTRF
ncbi:MAG: carbohydrate binding family 9 domain-containing protein, partial [Acidobacteria bacterium]|nr:carbohydrate binding family 9 domain-containing protein [Acidobacteriota bacterium]